MGVQKCEVCYEANSKYKCPSCLVPYCSLVCYKKHKETPCAKPNPSGEKSDIVISEPVSEPVEEKPFFVDDATEVLDHTQLASIAASSEIRDALKDEGLQKLIRCIDSSTNAEEELNKAMGSDVFRIFADKVLSAANP